MLKVLTAEEMREVDRLTTEKYGIPSILLMENAAHAAARVITEKLGGSVAGKSFLILCGKGNNGGDGAALARILWTQGASVDVILIGKIEETKGDAKTNFDILTKLYRKVEQLAPGKYITFIEIYDDQKWDEIFYSIYFSGRFNFVIDALFGSGLNRPLYGLPKKIVENLSLYAHFPKGVINTLPKDQVPFFPKRPTIFSIDIPTGLNADSSQIIGSTIEATTTITFTAPKLANVLPTASGYNGDLVIAEIGSPRELISNSKSKLYVGEKVDAQIWLNNTIFFNSSYKNRRGHALLIVGSKEYTGAAVLSGNAAMLSGVGLTTIATSETAQGAIAAKVLEEVITHSLPETKSGAISGKAWEIVGKLTEKVDAVGIGCGLSAKEETTKDFVRKVVEKRTTPIIIDADGLNALSPFDLKGSDAMPIILTPHEGEFLRLLGTKDKEILRDRVQAVRDFAVKHHVILVLKGERVLIGAPNGMVVINPTGNSGLGKAGNGDTLTGIITGFVAQAVQAKVDIYETVVAAVYISSLAGDLAAKKIGKRSMQASDVRECLADAFRELEN